MADEEDDDEEDESASEIDQGKLKAKFCLFNKTHKNENFYKFIIDCMSQKFVFY